MFAASSDEAVGTDGMTNPFPSLLWTRSRSGEDATTLDDETMTDLRVDVLLRSVVPHPSQLGTLYALVRELPLGEDVVSYRQGVLADVLGTPTLEGLVAQMASEHAYARGATAGEASDGTNLGSVLARLAELDDFVNTIGRLRDAMAVEADLEQGLAALREAVWAVSSGDGFERLRKVVGEMLREFRGIRSVKLGINLDAELRPAEVTLLSIDRERDRGSKLLSMLRGTSESEGRGIGELYSMVRASHRHSLLGPLFRELREVMSRAATLIGKELRAFAQVETRWIRRLKYECVLYAAAVNFVRKVEKRGLAICRPEVASQEDSSFCARNIHNPELALHGDVPSLVANQIALGSTGRVAVLTGPNGGGKTTFLQTIGLSQVLFQSGFCVAADKAMISVKDGVLTHYPAPEKAGSESGRFSEEAGRLRRIFERVSSRSLVLCNEMFATTGVGEAAYLLYDVIRCMEYVRCMSVVVTHHHDVAERVQNRERGRTNRAHNLVAKVTQGDEGSLKPAYCIVRGPPEGRSYAELIAKGNGILFEQIVEVVDQRLGMEKN